ncbi:MAG: hypothetical protein DRR16_24075 [Candidatus Parabeggiatoa sp. nov. 3]|nr:MAG: hypothetical protein DRR00_15820 [Gammaproteobacteria bacterium]RKZ80305.1 MAG: hypothetical protein DRR16_24075 [Gammaproteobacteria bacterium]
MFLRFLYRVVIKGSSFIVFQIINFKKGNHKGCPYKPVSSLYINQNVGWVTGFCCPPSKLKGPATNLIKILGQAKKYKAGPLQIFI